MLDVEESIFEKCGDGVHNYGAIYVTETSGAVIKNSIIRDNIGVYSGGIVCRNSNLTVNHTTFLRNTGLGSYHSGISAAISGYDAGKITIENSKFIRNTALVVGGVINLNRNKEATVIKGCYFKDNNGTIPDSVIRYNCDYVGFNPTILSESDINGVEKKISCSNG